VACVSRSSCTCQSACAAARSRIIYVCITTHHSIRLYPLLLANGIQNCICDECPSRSRGLHCPCCTAFPKPAREHCSENVRQRFVNLLAKDCSAAFCPQHACDSGMHLLKDAAGPCYVSLRCDAFRTQNALRLLCMLTSCARSPAYMTWAHHLARKPLAAWCHHATAHCISRPAPQVLHLHNIAGLRLFVHRVRIRRANGDADGAKVCTRWAGDCHLCRRLLLGPGAGVPTPARRREDVGGLHAGAGRVAQLQRCVLREDWPRRGRAGGVLPDRHCALQHRFRTVVLHRYRALHQST